MERQQTVLIADDEAQIREILSLYFKKEGFKVIEAADGAEALVQIQAGETGHHPSGYHDACPRWF